MCPTGRVRQRGNASLVISTGGRTSSHQRRTELGLKAKAVAIGNIAGIIGRCPVGDDG